MKCVNCNKKINDKTKFCPSCGEKVTKTLKTKYEGPPKPRELTNPKTLGGSDVFILIILIILMFASGFMMFYVFFLFDKFL